MAQLIDKKSFNGLKSFINERIVEVVDVYLRNAEIYVDGISNAFDKEDMKTVADNAHPLKSSSGNLGLKKLSVLCMNIEDEAIAIMRGRGKIDKLKTMVRQVRPIYDQSVEELKKLY